MMKYLTLAVVAIMLVAAYNRFHSPSPFARGPATLDEDRDGQNSHGGRD